MYWLSLTLSAAALLSTVHARGHPQDPCVIDGKNPRLAQATMCATDHHSPNKATTCYSTYNSGSVELGTLTYYTRDTNSRRADDPKNFIRESAWITVTPTKTTNEPGWYLAVKWKCTHLGSGLGGEVIGGDEPVMELDPTIEFESDVFYMPLGKGKISHTFAAQQGCDDPKFYTYRLPADIACKATP